MVSPSKGPPELSMFSSNTFLELRPLLFSIAYRMTGSVVDSEDLIQDTFEKWMEINACHVCCPTETTPEHGIGSIYRTVKALYILSPSRYCLQNFFCDRKDGNCSRKVLSLTSTRNVKACRTNIWGTVSFSLMPASMQGREDPLPDQRPVNIR